MHRADLSQTLAEALPPMVIRTAHRCIGFEQNARSAQLTFANGTAVEADVVVGADGIQSILQKYVVQSSTPEYSGSRAYRGLVPREKLPEWRKEAHQIWMGDGKHFMVYPVRRGELLNYVGFVPTKDETVKSWSAVGDRNQLAASFEGWDRRVVGLLEKVDTCFWWGLYDRRPLMLWTSGRLALLGDAAICIGALIAHQQDDHWVVDALGAPHVGDRSERELIAAFVDRIATLNPQLVTFNGSSFDLPVLRYRAMVHKVPAIGLSARPYFKRYTDDAVDLCEVLRFTRCVG